MNNNKSGPISAWILLITTLLLSAGSLAQELPAVSLDGLHKTLLRAPVEFVQTDAEASLVQVQNLSFAPLRAMEINRGISGETFWLRLRLVNTDATARSWVIHNDSTYTDHLSFFFRDVGTTGPSAAFSEQHLSDRLPFDSRPVNYRKLAFAHTTPAQSETELYIRLRNDDADAVSLNFTLWEAGVFEQNVPRESLLFGLYYGALASLLVIALILTVVLRERSYFYYACFLASTLLMWSLLNGLSFQYLWPSAVFLQNEGFHIAFLAFSFFAFQFSREFLRTAQHMPLINKLISVLQVVMVIGILLRFAGVYGLVLNIAYAALFSTALLPALGWLASRRGMHQARWYTVAWLVYASTLIVSALSAYSSVFSWGMYSLLYTQLGSLVEAGLLLCAIGGRILFMDRDRRNAIDLAHTDPLTGIGNRRMLVEHFDAVRGRFTPHSQPIFVILIDLDHFKSINDVYGHEAGDRVLQDVARMLQRFSRSDDACIRYGGDEFLMVVTAKDMAAAYQIAERIRTQFADQPTVYKDRLITHTLSIGVIAAVTQEQAMSTAQMLISVDEALYDAKTAGRNKTVMRSYQDAPEGLS